MIRPIFVYTTIISTIVYLLITSCAQTTSLVGGLKDTIPPVIVQCVPANFSTNYSKSYLKASIKFNEYIQLKDINKEFVISPPMLEKPDLKLSGKKLLIELKDSLLPNTTYTLSFGSALADLNEGNVLKDFQYVISTGGVVDSLSVSGKIKNAFTLESQPKVFVMLYDNLNDSAPYLQKPAFVAQSDTGGAFSINYIRPGKYRVFALDDPNNNKRYDMPNERIAFNDSSIVPSAKRYTLLDSITKDSVVKREYIAFSPSDMLLMMFNEDNVKQFLTTSLRENNHKCSFIFKRRLLGDSLTFTPLNFSPKTDWKYEERSAGKDTINFWITDSTVYQQDTLRLLVKYLVTDSLGALKLKSDSIRLTVSKKVEKAPVRQRRDREEVKPEVISKLQFKYNISSRMPLNGKLIMEFENPIAKYDIKNIQLTIPADSLNKNQNYKFLPDSSSTRKFVLTTKWKEKMNYNLLILPGSFTDIYGNANDTIDIGFSVSAENETSNIKLKLLGETGALIVQLVRGKDEIVRQIFVDGDKLTKPIMFDYIATGKYKIKLIFDANKNQRWDTGDYLKKTQPEKVMYTPNIIEIKAGMDQELEWTPSKK